MKYLYLLLLSSISFLSCGSTANKIFGDNRTPHEIYAGKIDNKPGGQQWLEISKNVLRSSQHIKLPYSHIGYFPLDKPRALALEFTAKQGEYISFDLIKNRATDFVVYADIFKKDGTHLLAADTISNSFGFNAVETGNYILRLQPELDRTGEYELSASIKPSLSFPVAGNKARVGSVWGDPRDGGKRSHEGIDIFAPKLTPVVAAADGYISRVNNSGIGGKTVSLVVPEKNLSLYYAHLDKQFVKQGQSVKKGDTLGLVGNTGNAKHTPSHLHFGIYSFGGPVDPLPYVNKVTKIAPALTAKALTKPLQVIRSVKTTTNEVIALNTKLAPLAITTEGYIAELSDGTLIQTPLNAVKEFSDTK